MTNDIPEEPVVPVGEPAVTVEETLTPEEWCAEYTLMRQNPPKDGDFLRTACFGKEPTEGRPNPGRIRLEILLDTGKSPFIFARIYIPSTVGTSPNWYVYGLDDPQISYGWKAILHPRSRDELLRRVGVSSRVVSVGELKVLRESQSQQSLIAMITEW